MGKLGTDGRGRLRYARIAAAILAIALIVAGFVAVETAPAAHGAVTFLAP